MKRLGILIVAVALLGGVRFAFADGADPSQLAQTTIDKSLAYLKSQQKPDFGWQDG